MKKICYITTVSGTLKGFVMPIAKYIKQKTDWEIYMMCNPTDEFISNMPDNIHLIPISMKRGIGIDGIHAIKEIAKVFRRERFDLIQYSTPNASFYAAIAGVLCRVPVRLYCQWGIAYVGFSGIKKKIFKIIEKVICRCSTWIEPDSNSNLRFAQTEGLYTSEKSSVIWNGSASGVDLQKFDIKQKNKYREKIRNELGIDQHIVLYTFVGRVTREKGINELLCAFRRLENETHNVKLMIVGPKEKDDSISDEIYGYSLNSDNIFYIGYTNNVEHYLGASDCYVLPSYREGFGMSVIEAEAMGLPVIVTNIPGPIDGIVEHVTGLIVEKKNETELYDAMKWMYNNPDGRMQYGNNGYQFVASKFDQRRFMEYVLRDRKRLLNE